MFVIVAVLRCTEPRPVKKTAVAFLHGQNP